MIEGKGAQPLTRRVRYEEDEAMEVEHLLAEPGHDRVSVDDFFHVDKTPDVNISGCESLSYTRQGGEGGDKVQVKLSEISQVDNNNSFEPSAVCEDYLLDTEFVDKDPQSDDIPREVSTFEKSSSETRSSGYSGSESSTSGISESPSTSNGKHGFKNGINDCVTICKLHSEPESNCNCLDRKEKTEQKSPILYTSQNRRKLQSRLGLLSSSVTNDMGFTTCSDSHRASEDASLVPNPRKTKELLSGSHSLERLSDSEVDIPIKSITESSPHKRLRKPPVRYIDEFSSFVSSSDEKHSISGTPRNKILKARTSREHDNGHKAFRSFDHAQSPNKPSASDRVACALSKEFSPVTRLDSDEETDSDTPDDYSLSRNGSRNYGDRRKHQKVWTLPEVVKLVDGISHYGVGRWTEIQRLFFPTSTYRTPVDLRDKWRNLLKASEAWMQKGQEEQDESQKNGHRQLPKDILHRISELGRLHPYPVKRQSTHASASASKRRS